MRFLAILLTNCVSLSAAFALLVGGVFLVGFAVSELGLNVSAANVNLTVFTILLSMPILCIHSLVSSVLVARGAVDAFASVSAVVLLSLVLLVSHGGVGLFVLFFNLLVVVTQQLLLVKFKANVTNGQIKRENEL